MGYTIIQSAGSKASTANTTQYWNIGGNINNDTITKTDT
jgi:hypothetical protein